MQKPFISLFLLIGFAQAQSSHPNSVVFAGGEAYQVNSIFERNTAPTIGLTYGYRLMKHVELDTGVFTGFHPAAELCSRNGCQAANDHYYWVPFGVKFVAPIKHDRLELSAGGGGMYQKYSVGTNFFGNGPASYDAWGGYATAGFAIAVDPRRRL